MVNVIFLDCDGVLNHQFKHDKDYSDSDRFGLAQDLVDNLRKIINSVYNPIIVISSSWRSFRIHPHVDKNHNWRCILEYMLGKKNIVYGDMGMANEFGENQIGAEGRALDIKAWLDANKHLDISRFVILDDECSALRKYFPNNVIDCDIKSMDGLTEKKANEAIWVLSGFGRDKNMTDNTWFTSDSHFYHENIIKICKRPFKSLEEMNEKLIENWNSVVGKDDIVWHLGDFCFGKKDNVRAILPRLNGKINLVMGNHDHHSAEFYRHPYLTKDANGNDVTDYSRKGFHEVYDKTILINGFFHLSHEVLPWIMEGDVYASIFGHVHNSELYKTVTKNSVCVCVERWNYTPISWKQIREALAEKNNPEDQIHNG